MKKYLLTLLAAALCLGFTACGDDEKEEPQPQPEPEPEVVTFDDYSSAIGMSLNTMLQKYGEPAMNFGTFYAYTYEQGNVTGLTFLVNPENNQVYSVFESLKEGAYETVDIRTYFASKYFYYGAEETPADEEEGIPASVTYLYGNTKDVDEATVVITVSGNTSVTYTNPKNVPEEVEADDFGSISPMEVISTFLGQDINDLIDEYGDALMAVGEMYMGNTSDNDYLESFAVTPVDDTVALVILLFSEDLEDADIIEYFTSNGFTATSTGHVDEEGYEEYYITNGTIDIVYQGGRAVVQKK